MATATFNKAYDALHSAIDTAYTSAVDNKVAVAAGGLTLLGLYGASKMLSPNNKSKPTAFDLSGGNIAKTEVNAKFEDYAAAYSKTSAVDQKIIKDKSKTQELVSTFYNLVTDICTWVGAADRATPRWTHDAAVTHYLMRIPSPMTHAHR